MKTRLLVIETATGGLDPARHALLSVAAVDSLTGEEFSSLVVPAHDWLIGVEALKVNGLTLDILKTDGRPEAEVVADLVLWLGARRNAVFAGCNPAFDRNFIVAAFVRHRATWPMSHRMLDLRGPAWLADEVGGISLPVSAAGQPQLDLDGIAKALGLARKGEAHDVLEDARLTLECFRLLVRSVEMAANGGGR